jgi:hypothetical protein
MITSTTFGQIGIGTTIPHSSAILEASSNNKGLLIPRISLNGSNDITTISNPATSLLIFNTNTVNGTHSLQPGYYYWNGSKWNLLLTGEDHNPIWTQNSSNETTSLNHLSDGSTTRNADSNLFISDKGHLGIGTENPQGRIEAHTKTEDILFVRFNNQLENDLDIDMIRFKENSTSNVTEENISAGGLRFRLASNVLSPPSVDALDKIPPIAEIRSLADSIVTPTSTPGRLEFRTTPAGENRPQTNMVINHRGKVGIGIVKPEKYLHIEAKNDSIMVENLAGNGDVMVINNAGKVYKGRANSSFAIERVIHSNYTVTIEDEIILADAMNGALTVTLPANPPSGKKFIIKKIDLSTNLVSISSTATIDGSAMQILNAPFKLISIVFSDNQWYVISQ